MNESLRILHTSDWHLGKYLENYSRLPEQEQVMEEIVSIANNANVELVIIAGDIFDTSNPPIAAIELFYKTIKLLSLNGSRPVFIIAGNHDNPDRIEAPLPLALESAIVLSGYPDFTFPFSHIGSDIRVAKTAPGFIEIYLRDKTNPIRLLLLPYANELRLKKSYSLEGGSLRETLEKKWKEIVDENCKDSGFNILIAHLFFQEKDGVILEESEDERTIVSVGGAERIFTENLPDKMHYVALGHLHRYQKLEGKTYPIIYSGSPIAYSLSESEQKKYVVIAKLSLDEPIEIIPVELTKGKKIFRKKFFSIEDCIEWLQDNQDSLVELTLVSDRYPKSEDLRKLREIHSDIISIIPIVLEETEIDGEGRLPDLTKNFDELFIDFYKEKNKGLVPSESVLKIFREISMMEEGNLDETASA